MNVKAKGYKRRYYDDIYIDYTIEQYKKGIYHKDLERLKKEYPNRVTTLNPDKSLYCYTIVVESERIVND